MVYVMCSEQWIRWIVTLIEIFIYVCVYDIVMHVCIGYVRCMLCFFAKKCFRLVLHHVGGLGFHKTRLRIIKICFK